MSNWIQSFSRRPDPRVRLFCFPHAGGTAAAFRPWDAELDQKIEVCAVQLPGRASRLREAPIADLSGIVAALLRELAPRLDRPFAFFGHSMGATVAFEFARALQGSGAPTPSHLFLSARRPPQLPPFETHLHTLSDDQFVTEINRRYGGIPTELLQHPDVIELLLPALRADIQALETAAHRPTPILTCPILAMAGDADRRAPHADLAAWRELTTGAFRVQMFQGGHFYLDERRADVLKLISTTMLADVRQDAMGEA